MQFSQCQTISTKSAQIIGFVPSNFMPLKTKKLSTATRPLNSY